MIMKYHIRAMQEQDIPFVSQIENQIFSLPWSEKSFTEAAAKVNVISRIRIDDTKLS